MDDLNLEINNNQEGEILSGKQSANSFYNKTFHDYQDIYF